jgi:hypothetical protein
MKTRQQLIDECRFAVNGLWQDFMRKPRVGSEYAMALEMTLAKVQEVITATVQEAITLATARPMPSTQATPNGMAATQQVRK